ncbi:fumarylacetoacetate hydrolase family protein [Paraburkholderia sp. PGU19]|uniref:fumarylacetoacetate hydrolase family protein n=1 Tax=Paraburkholderia sp. PGU19 TaxID=2735434 RepID=UPI0015DB8DE4|nr:fumarylacetoacetate hydrolase family protein [Paraburkholderia sp. PGU19]
MGRATTNSGDTDDVHWAIRYGVDGENLGLWTKLNGQFEQQGNSSDTVFSIGETLAYFSTHMTLLPGDMLATGAPPGVGLCKIRSWHPVTCWNATSRI